MKDINIQIEFFQRHTHKKSKKLFLDSFGIIVMRIMSRPPYRCTETEWMEMFNNKQ